MDHQFAFPTSGLLPATEKLTCLQCGRDAYQIFHCPDRKRDACTFVRRWGGRKGSIWGVLFLVGFLGLWAAAMFQTPWMLWVVPVGLLAWLTTIDLQLYKPNSGTMLERTSVFGMAVRIRVMTKQQMVFLPFKLGPLPRYPNLLFGIVVILSTMSLEIVASPFWSLGWIAIRKSGASLLSLVMTQIVIDSVASKRSSWTITAGRGLPA